MVCLRFSRKLQLTDVSIEMIIAKFKTISDFGIICRILLESNHFPDRNKMSEDYILPQLVLYPRQMIVQQKYLTDIQHLLLISDLDEIEPHYLHVCT